MNNETEENRVNEDHGDTYMFEPFEFFSQAPEEAIPCLVILAIASLIGSFGNILVITAVYKMPYLQNLESIFIVNLAFSDMYVTLVADPMSILAKLMGYRFFDNVPYLCQIIASICTISCINSLGSIALLSFNRYIVICHNDIYNTIFKKRTCICMCISLYCVGLCLVLLNQAGIGDHGFDHKSIDCIWDRMASYPFTVVFSIVLVVIPILVTGFSYLNIFRVVKVSQNKMAQKSNDRRKTINKRSFQLLKALVIIYVVFAVCWIPYAVIITADKYNTFSHRAHLYITVWAHLHPSLNWLVFYRTNKKFKIAFNNILRLNLCRRPVEDGQQDVSPSSSAGPKNEGSIEPSRHPEKF